MQKKIGKATINAHGAVIGRGLTYCQMPDAGSDNAIS